MAAKIIVNCLHCKEIHRVWRTEEIPEEVTQLAVNFCPICEDEADDYMQEYYLYEPVKELIIFNQLTLFPLK